MELYLNKTAAIIDLHERGFTEDFKIVGDRILWVQRKFLFKPKDLCLVEAYSFIGKNGTEQLVLGVTLLSHFADGILIWQFDGAFDWKPVFLNNKMKGLLDKVGISIGPINKPGLCKVHLQ